MTIIRPKVKSYNIFIILVFVLISIGGIFYIFEYNSFVDTRYQIKNLKKNLVKAQEVNVDLKNKLYAVVDPGKLESLAKDYNLVLEKNPEYLVSDNKISSSSLTTSLWLCVFGLFR